MTRKEMLVKLEEIKLRTPIAADYVTDLINVVKALVQEESGHKVFPDADPHGKAEAEKIR